MYINYLNNKKRKETLCVGNFLNKKVLIFSTKIVYFVDFNISFSCFFFLIFHCTGEH